MKKLILILLSVAVVLLSGASSRAELLSLYTFDIDANNSLGEAPNGTLMGEAKIAGGAAVGAGAVDNPGPNVEIVIEDLHSPGKILPAFLPESNLDDGKGGILA